MKNFLLLSFLLSMASSLTAQTLLRTRTADLQMENYAVSGDAILETFDDGSLQLRLTDDFSTPSGPDVRVYLGNGSDLDGAVEIVNLFAIDHFRGGISLAVPDSITGDQFDRLLIFCAQFNIFWASGDFGEAVVLSEGPDYVCSGTGVLAANDQDSVSVCPTAGQPAPVVFTNSRRAPAGRNYAYLITNEREELQEVVLADGFDFEDSGPETQHVYGINFSGELRPVIGAHRMETTSDSCFVHSAPTDFITIVKDDCAPAYACRESRVATHDWITQANVCTTDGQVDTVFLKNNIEVAPGEHYAFLLTDTLETVRAVITADLYDFATSGTETQRVYGINFDGELVPAIGQHRENTTATGCAAHSGADVFLTINKTAGCATAVFDRALTAAVTVYPNPTDDLLTIKLPAGFSPTEVSLIDPLGQTVRQLPRATGDRVAMTVAGLPAGRFLLRMADGERLVVKAIAVH
mgnify:CR=1 FL=1